MWVGRVLPVPGKRGMGNEAQLWGERVWAIGLRKVNGCALELERACVGEG